MVIQNEMFKFATEIELDEKTINEFTAALKTANNHCGELRQTIAKNQKDLMKMSMPVSMIFLVHYIVI